MDKFKGDYNKNDNYIIFTSQYLKELGECCGNQCENCPYYPKYKIGCKTIKNDKKTSVPPCFYT